MNIREEFESAYVEDMVRIMGEGIRVRAVDNTKFLMPNGDFQDPALRLAFWAWQAGAKPLIAENERLERKNANQGETIKQYHDHVSGGDLSLGMLIAERDELKRENEELRRGIDPKWSMMDQSVLVSFLREQTNFCADKFDAMIQFAVESAQYVELNPSKEARS